MTCDVRPVTAIHYSTVEIVDHSPPVIDPTARYWSRIAILLHYSFTALLILHLHSTPSLEGSPSVTFNMEKLEWWRCRRSLRIRLGLLVLREYRNVTDTLTDGQTPTTA